jgi:transposase
VPSSHQVKYVSRSRATHLRLSVSWSQTKTSFRCDRRTARRRGVPDQPNGYVRLLDWLRSFGPVNLVGVEGTGSYGAGLAPHLAGAGVRVVDRNDRQECEPKPM